MIFRDVREHRKVQMDRKLQDLEWDMFFDCQNPSENVQKLNDTLGNMFDECFPLISVKMSSRDPPYITPLVKHLCKIRNKNRDKYNDSHENAILQERINKLIRTNQLNAVSCENRKHKKGSKAWWDTANRISGRNKQDVQISAIVNAKVINDYFKEINTDPDYITPERLQIPDTVQVPEVEIDLVKHVLSRLKCTSSGPDCLPFWFWRDYANYLAPVVTHIFNTSIREQTVPSLWKLANIVPIPKESPLEEVNQLRPISLTNITMRVFERVVFKQELSVPLSLEIGADQFAYKRGQNCTMALIKCYHNWLEWLDGDTDFVRVFITFDFKKAFDYVSHYILSEKLKALKVNPYIINWIIDFLSDRSQRVTVDGITTEYVNINRGVPQGSVLGPVLFSIMVNDIGGIYEEKSLMIKFADDLTLSAPVKANGFDPSSDEIVNIQKWSFENRMSLNLEKTWEMVVRGKTNKFLPLPISGIERKNELKLFGVTLNENPCNWDTHIDSLLQKTGSRMYILRVCKFYGFPMKDLEMLFNSLIVSLFFYAIEVWGGAFQSKYLSRIDKFFKRAVRYGYTTKVLTINNIINDRVMKLWKSITDNSNHCLFDLLPPERTRQLRNRGHNYILPRIRTELFKSSFINRCLFKFI